MSRILSRHLIPCTEVVSKGAVSSVHSLSFASSQKSGKHCSMVYSLLGGQFDIPGRSQIIRRSLLKAELVFVILMLTSPSAVVDLRSAVYVHEPVHHLQCVSVLELMEGSG